MPEHTASSNSHYDQDYFESALRGTAYKSQRNALRLDYLLRHKSEGQLLELGCGRGGFLRLAAQHFAATGIDISAHAIGQARQALGDRVSRADIEREPLPPRTYNVIAAYNVLEHLYHPKPVIENIYSSLKTNGVLIGSVPNKAYPVGRIATFVSNLDPTHRSTLKPKQWRKLFREAGFHDIRFWGEIMLGPNYALYLDNGLWPYLAFNLIFACRKSERNIPCET